MELHKSKYSDGKTDGRDSRRENNPYRSFRNSGDDRRSRDDRGESTTVTCADCGDQCTVPFVPRTDKPVYCSDCFRKNKPQDSGDEMYLPHEDASPPRPLLSNETSSDVGRIPKALSSLNPQLEQVFPPKISNNFSLIVS